jgi:hypothetical protein
VIENLLLPLLFLQVFVVDFFFFEHDPRVHAMVNFVHQIFLFDLIGKYYGMAFLIALKRRCYQIPHYLVLDRDDCQTKRKTTRRMQRIMM